MAGAEFWRGKMKIDPANWPALSHLLDEWLELPADRRANWLADLGPEYSDLLPALRRMVATPRMGDSEFLDTLAKVDDPPAILSPGHRLGPYRILSVLGRGGMGVVYCAERDDGKFEQRVAIKVVSADMGTPAFVGRFQREYRILASLDHPNIARLLDAGASEEGLPYFVMEYVEGRPIDQFCAERKLSVSDRLRLFLQVCDAVQFAHQKLIVHRDLKPDNILVTDRGIPKLLDFGIARVLSEYPGGNDATLMAMTPAYASPEQVRGEPVETATDVYSLGCVLYKILTGVAPYRLQGKSPAESIRRICEEEPAPPADLNRDLGSDEDNILRMAMRKEASRRYRSVEQLGSDIGRCLNHEPVLARPAGTGYRLQKYVRRHRIPLGVVAGVVLLLVGFAVTQAVQLRRITRERDRADRIMQFMGGMFKVSDPSEARGNSVTAREILDRASKDIDTGMAKDPVLQAQLMHQMGQVYRGLGLYSRGEALLARAVEIRRRTLGLDNRETLSSMDELGVVFNSESRYVDAEKLNREVLSARRRILGAQDLETVTSMFHLAKNLYAEGHYADAEKLEREVLDVQRRKLGPGNLDTILTTQALAAALEREGRYAEAEKMDVQVVDSKRRQLGSDHPSTILAISNLGWVVYQEGHYTEAEKFLREAAETGRRVLGPEHPVEIGLLGRLGIDLDYAHRYPEAEKLLREVLQARRNSGPERYETVVAAEDLGHALQNEGLYREAEKFLREAVETGRRVLGAAHPGVLIAMGELGETLDKEGRSAEAEALERETVEVQRRVLGPEHPSTLISMRHLARALSHEQKYSEAEKLAGQVLDAQRRVLGPAHPDTALSLYSLAAVEARMGKRDEALRLVREADALKALAPEDLGFSNDPDLKALHHDIVSDKRKAK
jgi:tetratricopeptide (TPR) repeat protein/predicted Ser/Thr protein kinase